MKLTPWELQTLISEHENSIAGINNGYTDEEEAEVEKRIKYLKKQLARATA